MESLAEMYQSQKKELQLQPTKFKEMEKLSCGCLNWRFKFQRLTDTNIVLEDIRLIFFVHLRQKDGRQKDRAGEDDHENEANFQIERGGKGEQRQEAAGDVQHQEPPLPPSPSLPSSSHPPKTEGDTVAAGIKWVNTAASQRRLPSLCVEFEYSPCVHVGLLLVLRFPPSEKN